MQSEGLRTRVGAAGARAARPAAHAALRRDAVACTPPSMFRDPDVYRALRAAGGPAAAHLPVRAHLARRLLDRRGGLLAGHPARTRRGCYERCRIYATDLSDGVLRAGARAASSRCAPCASYTTAYQRAGGSEDFSSLLHRRPRERHPARARCARNVVFSQHNLVCDGVVQRVPPDPVPQRADLLRPRRCASACTSCFYDSLVKFGILALGKKESLRFTPVADRYEPLVESLGLYRRVR